MNPEDIVWNTITDSAKLRFGYDDFSSGLSEFDDGAMAENMLFLTIVGHAQKQSSKAIANDISNQFLMLNLGGDPEALLEFVEDRKKDLSSEIQATSIALALFEMGLNAPGVLVQVRSIIGRETKVETA